MVLNIKTNPLIQHFFQFITCFILGFTLITTQQIVSTYASQQVVETKPVTEISNNSNLGDYVESGELPSVAIDQAADFVSGKLYDVVVFLQIIAKPLCIIVGALSVVIALFGTFGDTGLLYKGVTGIILAAICYFGIMFAPEIIGFINSWISEGTDVFTNTNL